MCRLAPFTKVSASRVATNISLEGVWDHVPERHLGPASDSIEKDLQGDGGIEARVVPEDQARGVWNLSLIHISEPTSR